MNPTTTLQCVVVGDESLSRVITKKDLNNIQIFSWWAAWDSNPEPMA